MSVARHMDKVALGIVMMLVANFMFATLDTITKWLIGLGIPALQLAFLRYAGHFVVSLGLLARHQHARQPIPWARFGVLSLRAGLLVVATVGNFVALTHLPLTITSAIMFSAPIIVCFLSGPLLGEQVGPWRWAAILAGFAGVLVVIQPFGETFHWAALLSMFNAVCMALYSILTRRLSGSISTANMQLFGGAVGTVSLAPFAYLVWVPAAQLSTLGLWACLGVLGWSGHELLTRAHAFAPASALMPYSYSFLIYMTGFSALIFGHFPDRATLIGIVIIVCAGLLIWWREHKQAPAIAPSPDTRHM